MSELIPRERAAHWYYPDGRSCHTLPKKDGSGMKNTTLADARKLNLLPSVTSILSIKAKPSLDAWKLEQGILSALTLPRGEEETVDEFAKRVEVDMEEQSRKAAEFGTAIHAMCEAGHELGVFVQGEHYEFIAGYEEWYKENIVRVIACEKTVVNHAWGYAGRVDLVAETKYNGNCVIDIKTQKRQGKKEEATFYPEWGMQLAAYQQAIFEQGTMPKDLDLMSVVINSNTPSPVSVKVWEDSEKYANAFFACVNLWQFDRNYFCKQ